MSDARSVTSGFYVLVTGQIDGAQMQGFDNLYVKYSFNKGHDWSVLAVSADVSQHACRVQRSSCVCVNCSLHVAACTACSSW